MSDERLTAVILRSKNPTYSAIGVKYETLTLAYMTACDDRAILAAEVERLRAIEAAARDAGPWPITEQSMQTFWCKHCGGDGHGYEDDIEHAPSCSGVRLRDALEVPGG